MLIAYIGLYTLFLLFVWGFCIVAKIHAYKFKNFSNHIERVTFVLLILLLILSVFGYIAIFSIGGSNTTFKINQSDEKFESFSDIEY